MQNVKYKNVLKLNFICKTTFVWYYISIYSYFTTAYFIFVFNYIFIEMKCYSTTYRYLLLSIYVLLLCLHRLLYLALLSLLMLNIIPLPVNLLLEFPNPTIQMFLNLFKLVNLGNVKEFDVVFVSVTQIL